MNNMAELITVTKYWRRWENPTGIVGVFYNEDLNQVTWERATFASFFDLSRRMKVEPRLSNYICVCTFSGLMCIHPAKEFNCLSTILATK